MESRASGSSSSEYVRVCPFFFFFFFLRVHFREEEEGNCQWNDIQFDGSTVKRHVAKKNAQSVGDRSLLTSSEEKDKEIPLCVGLVHLKVRTKVRSRHESLRVERAIKDFKSRRVPFPCTRFNT